MLRSLVGSEMFIRDRNSLSSDLHDVTDTSTFKKRSKVQFLIVLTGDFYTMLLDVV